MTTPPAAPSKDPGIELDQVRTAADAAAWLRYRSADYAAEAATAPSPDQARGCTEPQAPWKSSP